MTVHILIPVHNQADLTLACLRAVGRQSYRDVRTVVIDDGSTDGTGERIRREFPDVTVLADDGGLWWTGAMAMGVRHVLWRGGRDDFILSVNHDIAFGDDYVAMLVQTSVDNGRAIVGSFCRKHGVRRVIIDQGCRIVWKTARRSTSIELLGEQLRQHGLPAGRLDDVSDDDLDTVGVLCGLDWLYGRGTLIPVEVLERVGNFDVERFPHYGGDTELFYRAGRAGFELMVSLRARITNVEGEQTTGVHHREAATLSPGQAWRVLVSRRSSYQLAMGLRFVDVCCPRPYRWRNKLVFVRTALALSVGRTRVGRLIGWPIRMILRVARKVGCRQTQR